jgi:hypothetical protein
MPQGRKKQKQASLVLHKTGSPQRVAEGDLD